VSRATTPRRRTARSPARSTHSSRAKTRAHRQQSPWREYLRALGPGLVTGASDDDPSGIATYSQAGAQFGYGLLWTSFLTFPLMATVQEICDRTALATGNSLGVLADKCFHRWRALLAVLAGLLILANALNIAADTMAVGEGMALLHAGPSTVWALLAGVAVTALIAVGSFEFISHVFKVMCLALLVYVVVMVVANPSWSDVLVHTLVPHVEFTKEYMLLLVAVLGTTISPYLFFWQSAHRIEALRAEPEGGDYAAPLSSPAQLRPKRKLAKSRFDVFVGMSLSNVVMFAIIVATGATIGAHGSNSISTAAQAATALRPAAGDLAQALFALGFIGSGMLALPVLAGAGAAAMAGFLGKNWGYSRSLNQAPFFYVLVAVGTVGGTLLTLTGIDPVKLLVYSALINGILAAPFLVLVMLIANNRSVMGERYRNGRTAQVLGWSTVALMATATVCYFVLTYLA
jgi:NRAMP (natural resistance-associated macrophage protein)-like metal ion transporter